MPKIALFDIDDSLADYTSAIKQDLHLLRSPEELELPDNIWEIGHKGYIRTRMDFIKRQPEFWYNLNPIQQGFDILNLAKKIGFEIYILTRGPRRFPAAWHEKIRWCHKWFGHDINIHIATNKGIVDGDFLYDDWSDYMNAWLESHPKGTGLMPEKPWNKDYKHQQVHKISGDLNEAKEILKKIYKGK